ncbi:cilia- and flagella-associated protein 299 [Drosophila grimshawi]|uniref:Cilia- and flagella-associated protein 299 n=1 Tax=Drosophila grimshawi TaxID=7222 RepID=B4JP59_DROGR|nr:cilia- and flagella-associated protein 299 [Drosophila grimshawi]EDV99484.1 GH13001 [Drosophila grimshawi]
MRGDFNLLNFETYAEYLESFTRPEEYRYLGNKKVINSLVKLGYRTNATIHEEDDFYRLKKHLTELINPKTTSVKLFGSYLTSDDPVLVALAEREERNLQKKLSTIIFLQVRQRSGFDISGYIDYADSLLAANLHMVGCTNWKAVFEGRIMLRPKRSHLSFFDWHSGTICYNPSNNYAIMHHGASLMFQHLGDHKFIPVTNADSWHKDNVKRTSIRSPMYNCIVLYDHVVRKAS